MRSRLSFSLQFLQYQISSKSFERCILTVKTFYQTEVIVKQDSAYRTYSVKLKGKVRPRRGHEGPERD